MYILHLGTLCSCARSQDQGLERLHKATGSVCSCAEWPPGVSRDPTAEPLHLGQMSSQRGSKQYLIPAVRSQATMRGLAEVATSELSVSRLCSQTVQSSARLRQAWSRQTEKASGRCCQLQAQGLGPKIIKHQVNLTRSVIVQMEAPKQVARRSDMDMNGHINNVTYLGWALETVPPHIADSSTLLQVQTPNRHAGPDRRNCFGLEELILG